MFYTDRRGTCLQYRPFDEYKLPSIKDTGEKAVFRSHELPLYRLHWPGQTKRDIDVPSCALTDDPNEDPDAGDRSGYTMSDVLYRMKRDENVFKEDIPLGFLYHGVVNTRYHDDVPSNLRIVQLPVGQAKNVVMARFALNPNYEAAILHLKWMAEGYRSYPLFQPFDTPVCDRLLDLGEEAMHLFFYMLGDCLYDPKEKYWARRSLWKYLACYLHMIGRTAGGTLAQSSGILGSSYMKKSHPALYQMITRPPEGRVEEGE